MTIKKKKRLLLLLLLSLFFSLAFSSLVCAAVNETEQVTLAYSWLSEQVEEWPSGAEDAAFALLALSYDDDLALKGKDALLASSKNGEGVCWPSTCKVKETALALLALNRIGYDTANIEEWLLAQNSTPTGMKWYLQIDSSEKCTCTISYDNKEYNITIGENKKIDKSAGSCLSKSYNDYFLKVSSNCQEKTFTIICDKTFLVSFLYEKGGTFYISSKTQHESAYGSIDAKISTICLGTAGCDYEGTLWAAFALQQAGDYDVNQFLPYLISDADNNKKYLPEAFFYLTTAQEDYASQLFGQQKMAGYWLASNTAHNKYYDTALALLALQSYEDENVTRAKEWLLKQQDKDGKWNNLRDTSFILYAVWPKEPSYQPVEVKGKKCREHKGKCIFGYDCGEEEWLADYDDCAPGYICCKEIEEPVEKTCSEMNGIICKDDERCETREVRAKDTNYCCLTKCEKIEKEEEEEKELECEKKGYTCKFECERGEREVDYSCPGYKVCCAPGKSKAWIWWLIILLLIAGLLFFLFKTGKIKRRPRRPPGAPKYPPGYRPGMPRRPMLRPMPGPAGMPITKPRLAIPPSGVIPRRPAPPVARPARGKTELELEETVKKLKKISEEK